MRADGKSETEKMVYIVIATWRGLVQNVEVYNDQTRALDRYSSLKATIDPDGFSDRDFYYFEKEVK